MSRRIVDPGAHIVIVGAGHAAIELCASLRQQGHAGMITLFSDDDALPYQRPPLSKEYLKRPDMLLALRPEAFYHDNRIDLRRGVTVTKIDRAARQVCLADGTQLGYDALVLATGASNVMPPVTGLAQSAPLALRSLADAMQMAEELPKAASFVIIGAGFIGLEAAALLSDMGRKVDVIDLAPRVMARAISPAMSEWFGRYHTERGVGLHLSQRVAQVARDEQGVTVTLGCGRVLTADALILAAGVRANDDLAQAAGLACNNGIVVGPDLSTADPLIFALGDVACFPSARGPIRLECVQNAVDQARYLAARLAGQAKAGGGDNGYNALPWFWSNQSQARLQIAGATIGVPAEELSFHVLRPAQDKLICLLFHDQHLVAVETVNAPADHMVARKLLSQPIPLNHALIAAHGFDLRAVLAHLAAQSDAAE